MNPDLFKQAKLNELDNEGLKNHILMYHERLKNLEELKKNDEQLALLREQLKDYEHEHFNEEIKTMRSLLKASRSVAKLRGIKFEIEK